MTRRRGNGEGCIHKEKSGRYRISISIWNGGKRNRITRTAWKHADAVAILDELRIEAGLGVVNSRGMTVAKHLNEWLEKIVVLKNKRAANTVDSYRRAIEKRIVPKLGPTLLKSLSAESIDLWIAGLVEENVGSRTIENAYKVLRSAIKWALITRRIKSDPMISIGKPPHEQDEIFPFSLEESRKILIETEGDRSHAAVRLGLTAGMRPGEILGLPWDNINLKAGKLDIKQQATEIGGARWLTKPKTKSSIRTIDLTPENVNALIRHRAILLKEGNAANPLVFPAPNGGIESRANFRQRVWLPILKRLGIAARGFHHARHTYATISLAAGIPVAVISKNLGHSKISITHDTYNHALPDHQTEAVKTISKLFA